MANAKYDNTNQIMSANEWVGARVKAYLFEGASFDKTHTLLSQVRAGATQRNVTEIQNQAMGPDGAALGLPAMFNMTPKGSPYQVVLAWDQNQADMLVLAYYDEDELGDDLALLNNGTFIVRPSDFDQATGVGTWFVL